MGAVNVVDHADAATEELVLVHGIRRRHRLGPEDRDPRIRADLAVDPVAVWHVCAGPQRADARLVDPVAAALDHDRGEDEVGGNERRQDQRVAPRKQGEEGRRAERDAERGPLHLLQVDQVVLRPPPRQEREGVAERARPDEACVRDEEREDAGDHGGRDDRPPGARDDAVGGEPEQRDQPERGEVEDVALLDPVDVARRGEGRHLGEEPDGDGKGRDRERTRGRRRAARCEPHGQERRKGKDPEREIEAGYVVEEEAEDALRGVAGGRRGAVGAEERERRAAASDRPGEGEESAGAEKAVEPRERPERPPQPATLDEPEQDRSRRDCGEERDRLRSRLEREHAQREQPHLPQRRRLLERDHEDQRSDEEDRVEGVLGHDHARVEHRRDEDCKPGSEEREALAQDPAGQEVRGDRGEGHRDRVDRLGGRVGRRNRVEERPSGRDQRRVHEAVTVGRDAADEELAVGGDVLRELGVDDFVDHDPRGDHPAPERDAHGDRHYDDPGEPYPGRDR